MNTIALLTDFGTKDYFVGALKGVILTINSKVRIIDITHDIEPQSIVSAIFILRACYRDFPAKTIFVAVIDPGVGSERRAILVETDKYFFIAPDNGILSFVFEEVKKYRVYELTNSIYFAQNISNTFHGRDIFAPVSAHLSGGVMPEEFGNEIKDFIVLHNSKPEKISENEVEAEITHMDRFGNLVTNLKKEDLPDRFLLEIGQISLDKVQNFYAEANKSEIFLILGSAGFLEIAAFQDSAKNILNSKIGDKFKLFAK